MFRQHGLLCYAQFHKQERERGELQYFPPSKNKIHKPDSQTTFSLTIFAGRVKTLSVCEVPRGDLLEARNRYYLQLSLRVSNIYLTLNWDDRVEDQRQLKAPLSVIIFLLNLFYVTQISINCK